MDRPAKRHKVPKLDYSIESMKKAIDAVDYGMSVRKAAFVYKVPRTTLGDKTSNRTPRERRMGHLPVLTVKEEDDLVE